jgi:hypothetical protein
MDNVKKVNYYKITIINLDTIYSTLIGVLMVSKDIKTGSEEDHITTTYCYFIP